MKDESIMVDGFFGRCCMRKRTKVGYDVVITVPFIVKQATKDIVDEWVKSGLTKRRKQNEE